MNAVEFDHVRFSYDGKTDVLHDISFAIPEGQFVCLLGGNGSGKSTLVRMINALLVPDEGAVRVFGRDTADKKLWLDIRATAGMVFQNPDDQLVESVVKDDVAFGPRNLGLADEEIERRVADALEAVGVTAVADREVHTLSGGQKQRVAIAGILAMEPRIIVFDEAMSMLDPQGRSEFVDVLRGLRARGMTLVMVTHDMNLAALADRAVVMADGRVEADLAPAALLADEALLRRTRLFFKPENCCTACAEMEQAPVAGEGAGE